MIVSVILFYFRWTIRGLYSVFLSSLSSSLTRTVAKIAMMANRTTPPRGFITNQLMIGVMTYAVINKAPRNMIMRSKRIVNTSLIFYTSLSQSVTTAHNMYLYVNIPQSVKNRDSLAI